MRPIDADAIEKFLKRLRRELPKESRDFFTRDEMILNFQQYVYMQPTIDAMPVVRCKECGHYDTVGCSKGFGWCESMDRGVSDDFYCANGAKMK